MKIIYGHNEIFYIAIHPRRILIITSDYFIRNKIRHDIHNRFINNRNLLINIEIIKGDY